MRRRRGGGGEEGGQEGRDVGGGGVAGGRMISVQLSFSWPIFGKNIFCVFQYILF